MSDQPASREDKKLPASERKLRKARMDGQVARSRDFGHVMIMGATMSVLFVMAGYFYEQSLLVMVSGLTFDAQLAESAHDALGQWQAVGAHGLNVVAVIGFVGVVAGIFAAVVPGGIALTPKPLQPKLERISPKSGFKRIFSRGNFADSAKLSGLVLLLTVIGGWYLIGTFDDFAYLIRLPLESALAQAPRLVMYGAAALFGLLVLAAFIDVPMQFFRHRTELKMTFQEARKEQKETDGDPYLKAKIRQKQREVGGARMMARVPSADVVINNPTHYSVALSYQNGESQAPIVVAKGTDHVALRIRALAMESGVPQVQAAPLARALYAHVGLEAEIPAALYSAVAQVLAFVFNLDERSRRSAQAAPYELAIDIPGDLDPAEVTDGR